jgi:hypothetical protein
VERWRSKLGRFAGRVAVLTIIVVGGVAAIAIQAGLTLRFQRELVWGVDNRARQQYESWRQGFAVFFRSQSPLQPIATNEFRLAEHPARGQLTERTDGSLFWYDGNIWKRVGQRNESFGTGWLVVSGTIELPAKVSGSDFEPIVYVGQREAADFIYLKFLSVNSVNSEPTAIQFGIDHWGGSLEPLVSSIIPIALGSQVSFKAQFDWVANRIAITVDGQPILEKMLRGRPLYGNENSPVGIGRNDIGASSIRPQFSGKLSFSVTRH